VNCLIGLGAHHCERNLTLEMYLVYMACEPNTEFIFSKQEISDSLVNALLAGRSRGLDSIHAGIRDFLISIKSRSALGPHSFSYKLGTKVKWQGREANHSLPYSAEVKNGGAVSSLPHISSWHGA
jgi:hypothetical protein